VGPRRAGARARYARGVTEATASGAVLILMAFQRNRRIQPARPTWYRFERA
jgi:hypothetical protein